MASGCPDIAELEGLAQGTAAEPRRAELRAHTGRCGACGDLLAEIRANLRFLGEVRTVLSSIHAAPGTRAPEDRGSTVVPPAPAPERVGPYRIVRELGRGGMGVVYEAEQASPRRLVALKLTNAVYAPGSYHERLFLSEVHALARLNDPGIAAIYEAGRAEDGRAYFAMELVTGQRLDAACTGLGVRGRLRLFARVCNAVAAAHERGVVHRDLKPSNIVVTERGEPKVLDFGLARVSEPEWAGAAAAPGTQPGRVAGTVPYMSPEQARGETEAVDIRSDVYSLGVVLYQVLTGRMPYEVPTGSVVRAAEVIASTAPESPGKVDRALAGDVETIVLTALEKEPGRRYRSARELGRDIERFLGNRPIDARPASVRYRVGKFLLRHRMAVGVAGLFVAVLLGFASAMTWMYLDAAKDRDRAENAELVATQQAELAQRSAEAAMSVRQFLVNMFKVDSRPRPGNTEITARELLDWAAARLKGPVSGDPSGRAALLDAVGLAYSHLGRYREASELLSESLSMRRDLHADRGMEVVETAAALGACRMYLDDLRGAEEAYRIAVEAGRVSTDGGHWHDALLQVRLADAVFRQGRGEDAEAILRPAIARLRAEPKAAHLLPMAMNALAGALEAQKKHAEAAAAMREAIALIEPHAGSESLTMTTLWSNLAAVLVDCGEVEEAVTLARKALEGRRKLLPASHPMIGSALSVLGEALIASGAAEQAGPMLAEAEAIYLEVGYAPEHQDLIEVRRLRALAREGK